MEPDVSDYPVRAGVIRRSALLVADQGLNSATNIVVIVLVAREASLQQFGVFATTQLGVVLGQTVAMAAIGETWLQADNSTRARRFATGMAVLHGAVLALLGIAVLSLATFGINAALIGLAAVPAIAGLDYIRIVLFAEGRSGTALSMDVAYGTLQLLGIGIWTKRNGWHGAAGAWLAWAIAAYVVFLVFSMGTSRVQRSVTPGSREPIRSALNWRYGAEAVVVAGGGQFSLLVVSASLGVTFNAIFRATSIPFGPLVVLLQASRALLIPSFRSAGGRRGQSILLGACTGYVALCGASTVLAYVITQTPQLRFFIGGINPSVEFVLLTGQLFLTAGLYQLVYYFFRARHWDAQVSLGRIVLVVALALGTVVSLLAGSSTTFLILASVNWIAATATMLAARAHAHWSGSRRATTTIGRSF